MRNAGERTFFPIVSKNDGCVPNKAKQCISQSFIKNFSDFSFCLKWNKPYGSSACPIFDKNCPFGHKLWKIVTSQNFQTEFQKCLEKGKVKIHIFLIVQFAWKSSFIGSFWHLAELLGAASRSSCMSTKQGRTTTTNISTRCLVKVIRGLPKKSDYKH